MEKQTEQIFDKYFDNRPFVDRFLTDRDDAVDVLIPVTHTNALWRSNLLSIFKEIPVNRLLIGDGGCTDGSIEVVQEFPRVVVFDHSGFVSLGYSLRRLIEAVETDWFIYLHSDVYLPNGWYDRIADRQSKLDWIESRQHFTVLVEYPLEYENVDRPYSGGQMGRKEVFDNILPVIEDDYLYRNEDIILARLVQEAGYQYGLADTHHYHQIMQKRETAGRAIKSVSVDVELSREEEIRTRVMQAKGLVKYLAPDVDLARSVVKNVERLRDLDAMDWGGFQRWVMETKPVWWPYIKDQRTPVKSWVRGLLKKVYDAFFRQ